MDIAPDLSNPLAGEFYRLCRERKLSFQRCEKCGTWRNPPRERCYRCGSEKWAWAPSSGRGHLLAWTTVYRAPNSALQSDVPYTLVIVEMDEGVRLLSRLVPFADAAPAPGAPLEVLYHGLTDDLVLPYFRTISRPCTQ